MEKVELTGKNFLIIGIIAFLTSLLLGYITPKVQNHFQKEEITSKEIKNNLCETEDFIWRMYKIQAERCVEMLSVCDDKLNSKKDLK